MALREWVAALGAVSACCGLVALCLPSSEVRLALLILFVVTGPGAAVVTHLTLESSYLALPLVLFGSLTISAILPTLMLWAHWWHPSVELSLLAVVCLASVCAALASGPIVNRR